MYLQLSHYSWAPGKAQFTARHYWISAYWLRNESYYRIQSRSGKAMHEARNLHLLYIMVSCQQRGNTQELYWPINSDLVVIVYQCWCSVAVEDRRRPPKTLDSRDQHPFQILDWLPLLAIFSSRICMRASVSYKLCIRTAAWLQSRRLNFLGIPLRGLFHSACNLWCFTRVGNYIQHTYHLPPPPSPLTGTNSVACPAVLWTVNWNTNCMQMVRILIYVLRSFQLELVS